MEDVRGLIHGMADARHGAEYGASGIPPRLRFGTFEVNLETRELRNRGIRIKLPRKPFQVLELLLKKSGLLVRREELIQQLWPNLHVNFEGGLKYCDQHASSRFGGFASKLPLHRNAARAWVSLSDAGRNDGSSGAGHRKQR